MKVIAVGDPHIKVDNISEVNMFIEKLLELIISENPDFVVILGDILHTHERLHTIPLNKAYEFIDKVRNLAETFVLVGNHDYIQNQQFLTENHWMNGMKEWKRTTIVDKVVHYKKKGYHFVLLPYVPPGRFTDALLTNSEDWKSADCIFAHQEFYGCKMGAISSLEGDRWDENFPNIVSGHIHSRQQIGKNIYYCGSSMQNAFGESEFNIIPVFSWESPQTQYNLREIDLGLPRKKIVYTDMDNIEKMSSENASERLKISLSGNYDEFKAFKKTKKYKELIKTGTKVVFKPKKTQLIEDNETIKQIDESDFNKILTLLVNKEKNNYLYQVYELVINDKNINEEDILFL